MLFIFLIFNQCGGQMNKHQNHLVNEKSPYLQQHADNPVDWYPWGEEAFRKAKEENKPIFLSIGYSTCHWCHVMEHESFEDEEIAEILNQNFIAIKVDREERPDVDQVYMRVCQMLTGSGGWPLTIFMTPDKKPFFAGTYFPKESKFGRMGLKELLLEIANVWKTRREEVLQSAEGIVDQLQKTVSSEKQWSGDPDKLIQHAYMQFAANYDKTYGGFGQAPKFPSPHNLLFLMEYARKYGKTDALEMARITLHKMADGGIRDHIGYGFHRYSTDRYWLVPHFEKMLYDQALLLMAYSKAYQMTGDERFRNVVYETVLYLKTEMMEDGLFYSAEDADSEGEEGKYYLWSEKELRNILDQNEFTILKALSAISTDGNFVDPIHGGRTGKNIIYFAKTPEKVAKAFQMSRDELSRILEHIREKLFYARQKRVHPIKDKKILTDWNALMIGALVQAGIHLEDKSFIHMAVQSYHSLKNVLTTDEHHLFHRFMAGESGIPGKLDDYAWYIFASLQLFQATQNILYLREALNKTTIVLNEFEDKQKGGFYTISERDESLIFRMKDLYDGAMPSGNSMMLDNLVTLYFITAENQYRESIDRLLTYAAPEIEQYPSGYAMFIRGIIRYLNPSGELIIVSDEPDSSYLPKFRKLLKNDINIIWINNTTKEITNDIEYLKNYRKINNEITFYFCKNFTCNLPVHDLELIQHEVK